MRTSEAAEAVSTALIARHLERITDHTWYIDHAFNYVAADTSKV